MQKGPPRLRLHVVVTGRGGRQEAAAVASLFALSTSTRTLSPRTLRPTHNAWAARLYVVKEVLRCLIEFAIATSTEEGYPYMLPPMAVGSGGILIHYTTVGEECHLFPLVVIEIDRHPRQAFRLVEPVNYILPRILEWHIRGYDSYQRAVPLSIIEYGTQAGYLFGDTSSGVQGQPFVIKFEVIGLTLSQVSLPLEVVDPMLTYDLRLTGFVGCSSQLEVGRGVKVLLGGFFPLLKVNNSGTDLLNFREVFVVLLKPSGPECGLRRSSGGRGISILSFHLLPYLGGGGTIF